ncbi:Cytochrome c552 [uncultured archaeon]|nr:Cytochrome c552 [uncultured archaeon]
MKREAIAIGIGIFVILLALAVTGSAHSAYSSAGANCSYCHGPNFNPFLTEKGLYFKNIHKFNGLAEPAVAASCTECHTNLNLFLPLNSTGEFYNGTHRYNDTTLASTRLAPPACYNCHVDVNASDFTFLTGTPTYLTSAMCENCHKAKYDNWTNTLHRVMLTEKSKAQAMGLPEPEVGWADISYVIVTKFEFAYINTTGYFPAQNDAYETETKEFVNSSHAGGAYGTCGRCHTTNWNASARNSSLPGFNGTFSEPGIACERCHKPAGNGHKVAVNYSGNLCRECHTGGNHGTGWENGEHAPPPYENGSCMFCHSSFDQYKNPNVTIANATGVSCGVCHNIHDMTDDKYAETFSKGIFDATNWSEVADSKLSFFNATASIAAGTDIFDDLSNRLLYPGTDTSRKDASYGTAPINVTGRPVSEVLCSMCHYRHGLAHTAGVNLTHSRMNYPESKWATCTDCHMGGTNATVGKDMMRLHANDPLTPNSCGGTTKCHTTSAQNLSASSHSVIPVINEWKASAHNDKEVGVGGDDYNHFYWNNTAGVPNSRPNSCLKCHSPMNWNPAILESITTNIPLDEGFKGITCAVCHNLHDMGDWLKKTQAQFGEAKAYAWYNKDAIVAATDPITGLPSRYKANYTMMANTTELCGNCHSNIRYGNTGPGWASATASNPISPHGYPAKDIFVGSVKQTDPLFTKMNFSCISCHMATMIKDSSGSILPDSQKVKGHSFEVNTTILMGTNCSNCHITGSSLGNLSTTIEKIQAEIHDNWNATNITVMNALAQIKAYSGEKNVSRDLIAKAYWNLRLVSSDGSWGVHNPMKARELLNDSSRLANEAVLALGSAGAGKPNITSFNPSAPTVTDNIGASRTFSIAANQTVNVTWYINGTIVQDTNKSVTEASYTNTSAAPGTWNVTAVAQNTNGSDMHKWDWIVKEEITAASISGFKIKDSNRNGKWDAGEVGLPGWNIQMRGIDPETWRIRNETTTDDTGFYKFEDLPAGRYLVWENNMNGYVPSSGPVVVITLAKGEKSANNNFTNWLAKDMIDELLKR